MLFYDKFVENIRNRQYKPRDKEIFRVEIRQFIAKFGITLPIIAIGVYEILIANVPGQNPKFNIGIGLALILLALWQYKDIVRYKITIDIANDKLINNEVTLLLSSIESCTLEELSFKRRLWPALRIIYTDDNQKKQLIIPLIMSRKEEFALCFKSRLSDRFIIK